jgi:hypothetical protein
MYSFFQSNKTPFNFLSASKGSGIFLIFSLSATSEE